MPLIYIYIYIYIYTYTHTHIHTYILIEDVTRKFREDNIKKGVIIRQWMLRIHVAQGQGSVTGSCKQVKKISSCIRGRIYGHLSEY